MYLKDEGTIWLATGSERVYLNPAMANRHGLIAGATGTGKTVTLKVAAESFSDLGVPVFIADIKGDVSGMCVEGVETKHIRRSIDTMHIENFDYTSYPVRFFDVYARQGHPVRTTISDMGPDLLARLLGLNETQSGVLRIVFKIADDQGLLLLDLKDLRSMVQFVGDNAKEYKLQYGNISPQSIGAIQRSLLTLEDEGGDIFFGEPAIDIDDWMQTDKNGRGIINVLNSEKLSRSPKLYATFMMWLMQELFERLPEAGDIEKPKLVFFFDEAHMLFSDAPKALVQKVEQMVKLIRSKGVGIYFVSQSPSDIPDSVLAQLSNRIQHALRAYTPAEQKAVKAAASAFRPNKAFKTEEVITELGVGEALVSCLDVNGSPSVVERAFILPPQSSLKALDKAGYDKAVKESPLDKKYRDRVDRTSAYEMIQKLSESKKKEEAKEAKKEEKKSFSSKSSSSSKKSSSAISKTTQKAIGRAASSAGREIGKGIVRSLFKK